MSYLNDVLHVASIIVPVVAVLAAAVALVVWYARKKFDEPAPKTRVVYRHKLTVRYKDGRRDMWYFSRDKNYGPVTLWKPFVRWWYTQLDKPYFAVQVPGLHFMLSRENIALFELRVTEHEEEA